MRDLRQAGKDSLRWIFEFGQKLGFDLLPRHFYSSVPGIQQLRTTQSWRKPFEMFAVAGAGLDEQSTYLSSLFPPALRTEISKLDVQGQAARENGQGGGYGVIEADVLYAFILANKPKRIVQVGCGVSTSIILRAAAAGGYKPEIICVEPYPSAFLTEAERKGLIRLHKQGAEECPRDVMINLGSGDFLFIDSTHAVKPGSEVNRIILDVLPRLAGGVLVHFHDIHFPYDYQRGILDDELFFSAESSLLHAFLIGNSRCMILCSLSMLHFSAPESIRSAIAHYDPQSNNDGMRAPGGQHFPSATYMLML